MDSLVAERSRDLLQLRRRYLVGACGWWWAAQHRRAGKNPSLSADGRTLAYEGLGGPDGDLGIWIANADGTNSKRVLNRPFSSTSTPAISPDGQLIVFFQSSGGPMGDLWIVPSSGGTPRRLTFDDTEGGTPTWTPDGQFVIFSSKRTGSHTLWRIHVARR